MTRRAVPLSLVSVTVGALAALSYLMLWLWGRSPQARYLRHEQTPDGSGVAVAIFVLGWVLMIVAMMLPTALPLLERFGRVVRPRRHRVGLQAMLVAGFVGVWALFGLALQRTDQAVHAVVESSSWLAARPQLVAGALLGMAGLYQFSGLKYRCLARCQSPNSFILRHWGTERVALAALRIGADYGLFCVGCCWTLMLVMFGVGSANVGIMLGLGAAMGIEKSVPQARVLSPLLGMLLLMGAGLVVTGAV